MNKIGFIGAGNMATAIINGMLNNNVANASDIYVFDLDAQKLQIMSEQGINTCENANTVVENCHFVVLAVKPQNYQEVLQGISSSVTDNTVMVSIAAGISIDYVVTTLGKKCPCVRVMPNTPLLLGCGATAVCPSDNIAEDDFNVVKSMFATSGVCQVLPESQMNTIISVNGSSPAYVYLFAKAMCDYATEQGISANVAMDLICATLKGSAEMLMQSGDTPDQLIKKVSSPGGTTIAALDVLDKGEFYQNIKNAMQACTKKAEELGK